MRGGIRHATREFDFGFPDRGRRTGACISDPPGYPRYGLSDEPDAYAEPMNYARGSDYRRLDQDSRGDRDTDYYMDCYPNGYCKRGR